MALSDEQADSGEEPRGRRVGHDLRHPLVLVGNDVEADQPLERVPVQDIGGAVPVVADDEDLMRLGSGGGARREDERKRGGGEEAPDESHGPRSYAAAG